MLNPNQLSWRLFGSVVAVMVLVFGALISSWVGMNAEEDGKQAMFEASSLARDALDAKSLAAEEDERHAVARADEALYRAKAAGRNRTEDVTPPPPSRAAAA